MNPEQLDFNQSKNYNKKRYRGVLFFVFLATVLIYGSAKFGLGSNEIEITYDTETVWQKVANLFTLSAEKLPTIDDDPDYEMPKEEKDRWDILILGIRGEDDENAEEAGALLTDTMMILSYEKTTKKTSLVSIPRDLYVRIYGTKKNKINSAYEVGVLRKNSLGFTKKLISRITGVYIDNAIVLNFSSFKKIINDLDGVDIVLDRPFTESQQWGYEFSLPAGANHLDGESALYYARSRYSSNDFDRAQRQQKLIFAIKDKVLGLNLLADPIKTLSILNSIRKNIETDLNIFDTNSAYELSGQFDSQSNIKHYVVNLDNLVYDTHLQTEYGNLYILLPKGDNLQGIKNLFQEIIK